MKSLSVRFVREDQGQDLIEYALLASLLSCAVAVAVGNAAVGLSDWYNALKAKVETWKP